MVDLDEFTVTNAALEQMANTANPRLKQIMAAAVRHMHEFVREVNLTPEEWIQGLQFLTAIGQACTPIRQEFILLSDVLGVSAVVNALHDKKAKELGSQSSLLGPFFREGAPVMPMGAQIVEKPTEEELVIHGTVSDTLGAPLANALIQVWQTSERGLYDLQERNGESMDMRGNFRTGPDGRYHFRTLRPKGYSIPMDGPAGALVQAQGRHGMRPSHVHMLIGAEGHRELVTALYFGDDDYIESDTVFGVSQSLVVAVKDDPDSPMQGYRAVRYDFKLGKADPGESGRVGADPTTFMNKAAE
ncbi:MAG: hydroxyquinol 1,2-dioxygenase [Acetobacteraceae bacterium]|nr:hydroxyquinol 1,2-dioxygenase [Acetobacteraceae bacterium]